MRRLWGIQVCMYYVCNVTNNERLSPASRDMLISLKAIFSRTNMSSYKCQKYMMISSSSNMVPCSRNYRSGNRNVRCEGRAGIVRGWEWGRRHSARVRVGETGQYGVEGGGDRTVRGWGWGRRDSVGVRVGCPNLQGMGDGTVWEVGGGKGADGKVWKGAFLKPTRDRSRDSAGGEGEDAKVHVST